MPSSPPAAARDHLVDVGDGLSLHAAVSGRGAPLVLLHGFTGCTSSWDALRPALSARHTVIAIDLPGHGRSTSPSDPSRYALPRTADDVGRVLEALGVERAAVLGYSLGGRVALHLALQHPAPVTSLLLESSSPGILDAAERERRMRADAALADRIERDGVPAFVEHWQSLSLWDSQAMLPGGTRDALRAQRLANRADGLARSLRGAGVGAQGPLHERLAELPMPVLLVAGALDGRYVEQGRLMQRVVPHARLTIVEDAGHAVHLERPAALAAAILSFLGAP